MIVTVIYPKEVTFPFNIPCLDASDAGDKIKCADMITRGLMGDGWETETVVSKNLGVRPMRWGDMILFPDGETWVIDATSVFRLDRSRMIDYQQLEVNKN